MTRKSLISLHFNTIMLETKTQITGKVIAFQVCLLSKCMVVRLSYSMCAQMMKSSLPSQLINWDIPFEQWYREGLRDLSSDDSSHTYFFLAGSGFYPGTIISSLGKELR